MRKVLIIGATGNTGTYLVDYCLSNLDKNEFLLVPIGKRETNYFASRNLDYISIDITQADQFKYLPNDDIHAVILLAACMPSSMKGYNPIQYLQTNIVGAFNVLEYCRKVNVDRIIYTQTIREIGNLIGEKYPIRPLNQKNFSYTGDHAVYVISKNTAVDLIEHFHKEYGLKRFIFRLPTIYSYSPNDSYYLDGKKIKKAYRLMINQAILSKTIEMWGNPNKAHDVVYVKDLCQILTKAITVNRECGYYNVGTGNPISLKDQIEGIIRVFSPVNNPSTIVPRPEMPDSRSYSLDITNAREELGYEPKYDYISYLYDFKAEMELNRYKDLH